MGVLDKIEKKLEVLPTLLAKVEMASTTAEIQALSEQVQQLQQECEQLRRSHNRMEEQLQVLLQVVGRHSLNEMQQQIDRHTELLNAHTERLDPIITTQDDIIHEIRISDLYGPNDPHVWALRAMTDQQRIRR